VVAVTDACIGGFTGGHCVQVAAVSEGTQEDVASWLELAREVEPLFGPMPEFELTLRRNISRGTALCVRDVSGQVVGGILLRAAPHTQITWLAVRSSARGRGVGRALVAGALRRCPPPCDVLVDTFGEDNIGGGPARRLYESFGFVPGEYLPDGPEGGSRQRFRLRRR
jgi:ribosomal protein S18 acetylase RimI-like enzyme